MRYNINNWNYYHSLKRYDNLYENIKEIFNKKVFKVNKILCRIEGEYKDYIYELFNNYNCILHHQFMNEEQIDKMYFIKYPYLNSKYRNILKDYLPNDIINEICKYINEYVYLYIPFSFDLVYHRSNNNIFETDTILDTIIVLDNVKQIERFYNKCIYNFDGHYCDYNILKKSLNEV